MKKKSTWAFALIACLTSCSPSETESIQPEETLYPVQFTLQLNSEILPFAQTKSIPSLDTFPEPSARNGDNDDSTDEDTDALYKQIEYIVYRIGADGEKSLLKNKSYTEANSEGDFGIIYDKLPAGIFEIAFITHSSATPSLSNGILTFNKISDTFWCTNEYEISSTNSTNETPTLSRIIGKIEFVSTDAVPAEQAQFSIHIQPFLFSLDVFTGKGSTTDESHTITTQTTDEMIGQTGSHQFYTFVPGSDTGLDITLTSSTADGETLRQRLIEDVMPLANRTIRYTGVLYTNKDGDSFELSIDKDGNWDETDERELSDDLTD